MAGAGAGGHKLKEVDEGSMTTRLCEGCNLKTSFQALGAVVRPGSKESRNDFVTPGKCLF